MTGGKFDNFTPEQALAELRRLSAREERQKDQLKAYSRYDQFGHLSDEDIVLLGGTVGDDVPPVDAAKRLRAVADMMDPTLGIEEKVTAQFKEKDTSMSMAGTPQQQQAPPQQQQQAPRQQAPQRQVPQRNYGRVTIDQNGIPRVTPGMIPNPMTPEGQSWYAYQEHQQQETFAQQQRDELREELRAEVQSEMLAQYYNQELQRNGINPADPAHQAAATDAVALMQNNWPIEDAVNVVRQRYQLPEVQQQVEEPQPAEVPPAPAQQVEVQSTDPPGPLSNRPMPEPTGLGSLAPTPATPPPPPQMAAVEGLVQQQPPQQQARPQGQQLNQFGAVSTSDGQVFDDRGVKVPDMANAGEFDRYLVEGMAELTNQANRVGE